VTATERAPYRGDNGLWVISRTEFARDRFHYKPGEHVVFGGPTQRGKTTLAFALLQYTATPELPAYVAVSKPNDPTTAEWGEKLGYRRVSEWPPIPTVREAILREKPSGYLIWPKFGDMDKDVNEATRVTRMLLTERYTAGARGKKKSQGILVMDDTMIKAKILHLDREMTTILAMAGAMGIGQWSFVQKPTDSGRTPLWAYGASEHVFLVNDPDARSRKRYAEIGGVDGNQVAEITQGLEPFQFLYMKRTESYMCVVDYE
jgi:hypothetical protein